MLPRLALLTIGQTPRVDLVPDLLRWSGGGVEAVEVGALDGFGPDEIAALAPAPGEPRLVTRLRGGGQAVLSEAWVHGRVQALLEGLDGEKDLRAVVLLCTGPFPELRTRSLLVRAQEVVDHGVAALAGGARRVGILLPLAEQVEDFHLEPAHGREIVLAHASPYEGDRFAEAGGELSDADVVVMHCMGYTEAQRAVVAETSGRPVLLARRLLAAALAQLA